MPRSSPIINVSAFPEGERKQAVALLGLFGALSHYTDRFEYALRLFELSEGELAKTLSPGPKMEDQDARFMHAGWMQIAARDATMTLFHFAKTIDEIRGSLRYLPTLRPLVKNDAIRVSAKLFRARFPNYLEMRHTVAHSGETASLEARARDAVGTISMRENLLGRRFTSTVNGRYLSTEISPRAVAHLADVQTRFFSAFKEAHGFVVNPTLEGLAQGALEKRGRAHAGTMKPGS